MNRSYRRALIQCIFRPGAIPNVAKQQNTRQSLANRDVLRCDDRSAFKPGCGMICSARTFAEIFELSSDSRVGRCRYNGPRYGCGDSADVGRKSEAGSCAALTGKSEDTDAIRNVRSFFGRSAHRISLLERRERCYLHRRSGIRRRLRASHATREIFGAWRGSYLARVEPRCASESPRDFLP
jgi:hypothetical protein